MIGRSLGTMTTAIIQALITVAVALIFGIWYGFQINSIVGLLLAVVFMILTFSTFVGFGITLGGALRGHRGLYDLRAADTDADILPLRRNDPGKSA